jgi:hypothetical protein
MVDPFQYNIDPSLLEGDFGFSTVDQNELGNLLTPNVAEPAEIAAIKDKLDMILEMNSTCEGAMAVKSQYDELLKARMTEIEKTILPLLASLKKNKVKDYIFWPGVQREAQCDLQIQKLLSLTRAKL